MKIYINGNLGKETHEDKVEEALKLGWVHSGGNLQELTIVRSTEPLTACMETAKNNNAQFVHRSYTGANTYVSLAESYYPDVILSMPPGSNEKIKIFDYSIPQKILLISSGDNGINETGYNTEFVENDPITAETVPDELDLESFGSSYGLGKIAYIMHSLNCSSDEARARARATGSEGGVWHQTNGFGKINVGEAVNYGFPKPPKPKPKRKAVKYIVVNKNALS